MGRLPVDHRNFSFDFKLKQFLRGAAEPLPLAHQRWLGSFSGPELTGFSISHARARVDVEAEHLALAAALAPWADPLTRSLALYQETYLPEDILTKVDRASMACGLEVRAPFLDAELVDAVQRLPARFKYGRKQTKRLLKARSRVGSPDRFSLGPRRASASPSLAGCEGRSPRCSDRLLEPGRLERQGLFRPDEVARRVGEHRSGIRDHRKPLWTLLMFQLWYDAVAAMIGDPCRIRRETRQLTGFRPCRESRA